MNSEFRCQECILPKPKSQTGNCRGFKFYFIKYNSRLVLPKASSVKPRKWVGEGEDWPDNLGKLQRRKNHFPSTHLSWDPCNKRQINRRRTNWSLLTYISHIYSVQFSSVTQSCPALCDTMNHSTPGLPVHHQLPEFTQTHVHWVSDAIQPSHLLSSPSPPAFNLSQHQGLFKWVSSSHQVAKVLELQLQHQSFHWIFKTDLL